ncbi:MAG: hypothetical protein ABSC64_11315 [Candidatus Korobacteraceae bacterium]
MVEGVAMAILEQHDDPYAADFTRLGDKLNRLAESTGKPAVFRVIPDQANSGLSVRYGTAEEVLGDQEAYQLMTTTEKLAQFARKLMG